MRLTLRTMLAYMDDILEPADREEISRKIEDSEFARNLMQRIQESVQKARLGAPKVNAKGLGLDANTVAEYLDNTLSGERVPDFERVCLESDIHLAEVAACHQVLTMVLGRPAEVDPAMKRKMYKIAERIAAGTPPTPIHDTPTTAAEDVAEPVVEEVFIAPSRHRPEVPAYLRERSSRSMWRTVLAAIVLLALLGGAITMALGPLDWRNPVLRALGIAKPPQEEVARNNNPVENPAAKSNEKSTGQDSKTDTASTEPATIGEGEAGTKTSDTLPTAPMPGATVDSALPMTTPTLEPASPALPSNPDAPSLPTDRTVPPEPMPPGENTTNPPGPSGEVMRNNPGAPVPMPGDTTIGNAPAPMPEGNVPPEPMPSAIDLPLGRFIPNKGVVLLRLNTNSGNWDRIPPGAPLAAGDKLLVLPTYRPTIALTSGLTLQLSSETMVELLAADSSGIPGLKLMFGRCVAMTTGQAGAQLRLELGPATGVVTFVDADATLGLDVRLFNPIGVDPEKTEPLTVVEIYDAQGQLEWTPAGGEAVKLTASQRLPIIPHPLDTQQAGVPVAAASLPPWIEHETFTPPSIGSASPRLADELSDEKRSLLQVLREFGESQRLENRLLVAECLALIDQFDPMIDGLNDEHNKAYWGYLVATARNALARGPATAVKLRQAYEQRRGQTNGQELYRMLGGYTKEQLTTGGAAAELVNYLDHESLDFRVLAITNLREITDKHFNYMPQEKLAVNRRGPVNRWKQELSAGRIVPKEPAAAK